ncbi:heterokaryon incompatibility protein-domain-containing protein [Hypoxylon fuscum]|nr:heterokaryon incompatibility protein-domain-containing protein [Hypoxylon fuscum]
MWLINTSNFKLERHDHYEKGSYAILSHTWEEDEVSFQDFSDLEFAARKRGFTKIMSIVEMARARNLKFAWIDTCCIDKTSSSELSEAINSMFRWYEDSAVCFAHLSDMPTQLEIQDRCSDDFTNFWEASFKACRWFARGWTLQELIAPINVEFYDTGWNFIGNKIQLSKPIEALTKIPAGILIRVKRSSGLRDGPHNASIACRMSWASARQTTRVEDTAYCLLGLFDINIPLLYGEGSKAFIRLQEEICRNTTDMSLFAWKATCTPASSNKGPLQEFRGLFANHPCEFSEGYYVSRAAASDISYRGEIAITNRGIRFDRTRLWVSPKHGIVMSLNCNCHKWIHQQSKVLYICLARVAGGFARHKPSALIEVERRYPPEEWKMVDQPQFYISKDLSLADAIRTKEEYNDALFVRFDDRIRGVTTHPVDLWDPHRNASIVDQERLERAIYIKVGDSAEHSESFINVTLDSPMVYSVFSHKDPAFPVLSDIVQDMQPPIDSFSEHSAKYFWTRQRVGSNNFDEEPAIDAGKRFSAIVTGRDLGLDRWISIDVKGHEKGKQKSKYLLKGANLFNLGKRFRTSLA